MTLKPTTKALIRIAKERRRGLKAYHKGGALQGATLKQVRKYQANSIKDNRKTYGRAGNIRLLARGYGSPSLTKKYGS